LNFTDGYGQSISLEVTHHGGRDLRRTYEARLKLFLMLNQLNWGFPNFLDAQDPSSLVKTLMLGLRMWLERE